MLRRINRSRTRSHRQRPTRRARRRRSRFSALDHTRAEVVLCGLRGCDKIGAGDPLPWGRPLVLQNEPRSLRPGLFRFMLHQRRPLNETQHVMVAARNADMKSGTRTDLGAGSTQGLPRRGRRTPRGKQGHCAAPRTGPTSSACHRGVDAIKVRCERFDLCN
jgi:hypothetical protein